MDALIDLFSNLQASLFESVLQPIAFAIGLGNRLEEVFNATGWLLVGVVQIAIMLLVISPLQRWRPAETQTDTQAIRTDVIYTLIHRLGLFRVVLFFSVDPLLDALLAQWRSAGMGTFHLEDVWPGVTDGPVVSFIMYLVVFDFLNYWLHRAQHQFNPWWALHALHHSQRQMTQWTDNRNHLLDDVLHAVIWVMVAQLIGIARISLEPHPVQRLIVDEQQLVAVGCIAFTGPRKTHVLLDGRFIFTHGHVLFHPCGQ